MNKKIWVLHVCNRGCDDITLWEDERDAINALSDFVRGNWDDQFIEDYGFFDEVGSDSAIDHYFLDSSCDSYSLECLSVNGRKNNE